MRTLWKVLGAAAAFAFGTLLMWEFWLKDVWGVLALPRLNHYWYGIFFMLGALIFHLRRGDKRAKYFLFTVGLIWFLSDFPDFADHLGSLILG